MLFQIPECGTTLIRPVDIVVLVHLYVEQSRRRSSLSYFDQDLWTYQRLADDLLLPKSTLFRSIQNAESGRLLNSKRLNEARFIHFLMYGVPVIFPATPGAMDIGTPTSMTANLFGSAYQLVSTTPHIWPNPNGQIKGITVEPLHACAIGLAERDSDAHRILAAVDGLRLGGARETETSLAFLMALESVQ